MSSLEEEVRKVAQMAHEAREKFAMAFLAETGLMPSQVEMKYAQRIEGDQMVFRVWFVTKDEAEEQQKLRDLCARVAKGEDCKDEAANIMLAYSFAWPAASGVIHGH